MRRPQYDDLAAYLKHSGVTQTVLADAVHVTQAHISRIASGAIVPRPRLAARIARLTGIPLDSFMRVYLAKRRAVA